MKNLAPKANHLFHQYCKISFDQENEFKTKGETDAGKYEIRREKWTDKVLIFLQKIANEGANQ